MEQTIDNELSVHVVGTTNSGKTTIQLIIAEALRKNGFNVEINSGDFDSEEELVNNHSKYQDKRIEALKDRIKLISVNEVQAVRKVMSNGTINA